MGNLLTFPELIKFPRADPRVPQAARGKQAPGRQKEGADLTTTGYLAVCGAGIVIVSQHSNTY